MSRRLHHRAWANYPLIANAVAIGLAGAVAARSEEAGGLQEVVVTATRRQENVLDVPYNISAISSRELETAGISDLQGLTSRLPGMVAPDLGPRANSTNSQIIIRGLNTADQSASYVAPNLSVPLVSTYVDEVPLFVNLSLTDINRVEVLRGPQGTLYGSGAVGGTLRLIHNQPDPSHFTAELSTSGSKTDGAENGNYSIEGIVNLPITPSLALRASAGYESLAGFINAPNTAVYDSHHQPVLANPADPLNSGLTFTTDKGIDYSHSTFGRVALLWKVAEGFDAELAYQLQRDFSNGFSAQLPGTHHEIGLYIPNNPIDRDVDLYALTLSGDFGFATMTSSTSYTRNDYHDTVDLTGLLEHLNSESPFFYGSYPRMTSPIYTTSRDQSFVEELRLVSKSGGSWDYVLGGFFRHETTYVTDPQTAPGLAAWSELPGSADSINAALGTPGAYANFGDYVQFYNGGIRPSQVSPTDFVFNFTRNTDFKDRAIYGELTGHVSPKWQITGGARTFWQDFGQDIYEVLAVCGALCSDSNHPGNPNGVNQANAGGSFHSQIFKLNSSYELTAASRLYATISQGFRHGGANAYPIGNCAFCEPNGDLIPYKSDRATNYEVGYKGTAANWLRYSGAIYRVDWRDIQLETFSPTTGDALVINGDTARSQGIELELTVQPAPRWTATLGYGYTDSKLTSSFVRGIFVGFDGDRLPGVPRNQVMLSLDHTQPVGSAELLYHLDASYRSSVNTTINDAVVLSDGTITHNAAQANFYTLPGFTVLNGSIGIQLGQLTTRFYVSNATNQDGVTAVRGAGLDPPHNTYEYLIRPRTVGVNLEYRFGQ